MLTAIWEALTSEKTRGTEALKEDESDHYFEQLPDEPGKYRFHYLDYVNVAGFRFTPDEKIYNERMV